MNKTQMVFLHAMPMIIPKGTTLGNEYQQPMIIPKGTTLGNEYQQPMIIPKGTTLGNEYQQPKPSGPYSFCTAPPPLSSPPAPWGPFFWMPQAFFRKLQKLLAL